MSFNKFGVLTVFIVIWAVSYAQLTEKGCPDAEDIQPCVCYQSLYTVLECQNLTNSEALRKVFKNSARYTYHEIYLKYSSLQYLPRDMFEETPVRNLNLVNVTLGWLFDTPPDTLSDLSKLHIENSKVISRMQWDLLEPMTKLKFLNIYFGSIKILNSAFSTYVTKELQQLTFYATETKTIKPGVFKDFINLTKIAIDACKLTMLSRDMFPTPFNVSYLHFNENKISTIPEDLFTDMPNLQTLSLRGNQIAILPESAFRGSFDKLVYLILEGNPLKCDCLLYWLISKEPAEKPKVIKGTCACPKKMNGKELKVLTTEDFNC